MRRDWKPGDPCGATAVIQAKKKKLFSRENGTDLVTERDRGREALTPCFWFAMFT